MTNKNTDIEIQNSLKSTAIKVTPKDFALFKKTADKKNMDLTTWIEESLKRNFDFTPRVQKVNDDDILMSINVSARDLAAYNFLSRQNKIGINSWIISKLKYLSSRERK